jgi:integrase
MCSCSGLRAGGTDRRFAGAVEDEVLVRNPASLRERPRPKTREPRAYSMRPKQQPSSPRCRVGTGAVWTLAVSGVRIGVATALRVRDLDLRAGVIRVHANAPEVGGHKLLDQRSKTEPSTRDVDIPAPLSTMLTEHLNTCGTASIRRPVLAQLRHASTTITAHDSHAYQDKRQAKVSKLDTLFGSCSAYCPMLPVGPE